MNKKFNFRHRQNDIRYSDMITGKTAIAHYTRLSSSSRHLIHPIQFPVVNFFVSNFFFVSPPYNKIHYLKYLVHTWNYTMTIYTQPLHNRFTNFKTCTKVFLYQTIYYFHGFMAQTACRINKTCSLAYEEVYHPGTEA